MPFEIKWHFFYNIDIRPKCRRTDDGSTPTHAAAFSCVVSVLKVIVQFGGDLRIHDDRDLLPRDWTVEAGCKRNKKMLDLIDGWQQSLMQFVDKDTKKDTVKTTIDKTNTSMSRSVFV